MLEVAQEVEQNLIDAGNEETERLENTATENGMEVIKLSDEEFAEYREAFDDVFEDFASKSDSNGKIMEIIREEMQE